MRPFACLLALALSPIAINALLVSGKSTKPSTVLSTRSHLNRQIHSPDFEAGSDHHGEHNAKRQEVQKITTVAADVLGTDNDKKLANLSQGDVSAGDHKLLRRQINESASASEQVPTTQDPKALGSLPVSVQGSQQKSAASVPLSVGSPSATTDSFAQGDIENLLANTSTANQPVDPTINNVNLGNDVQTLAKDVSRTVSGTSAVVNAPGATSSCGILDDIFGTPGCQDAPASSNNSVLDASSVNGLTDASDATEGENIAVPKVDLD